MKKFTSFTFLSVLCFLIFSALALASGGEVRITFPARPVAGAEVRYGHPLVIVHYGANDKNRLIELAWEPADGSDGESGDSAEEINSQNDSIPVVRDLDLSPGQYVFRATLYRSDGTKIVATQTRFVTR